MRKTEKTKLIRKNDLVISTLATIVISFLVLYYSKSWTNFIISLVLIFLLSEIFFIIRIKLNESGEIKKMESAFPDFIQLMASNLRAGMTIDSALLVSSRKEFAPLDKEITRLGKDLVTGKDISIALTEMSKRINSDRIRKTITLINSGIRSGGNLAMLLEQTASSTRERGFVEKRAASNVLMYVIFIFFAVALGAPALFGLSSVLVGILTNLLSTLPQIETDVSLPFTLTSINISLTFITYFTIVFMVVTNFLASFILGLVSSGEERNGLKYFVPLTVISLTIYFIVRLTLSSYFSGFFG